MAKPPVHEIRFGLIKVTIWKKNTQYGPRYNVTTVRRFKDGDVWRDSTIFGRDDLPLLSKAIDMAHTWIYGHAQDEGATHGE